MSTEEREKFIHTDGFAVDKAVEVSTGKTFRPPQTPSEPIF